MRSSSASGRRLVLAALLALSGAPGCAHAPRERPAAPVPDAEASRERSERPPEGRAAPDREEEGRERSERPPGAPARLDPSEEITPEELATIPEPVPRGAASTRRAPSDADPSGASSGTTEPAPDAEPSGRDFEAPAASSGAPAGVWRVQIYASESRAEADRVARAASARLGAEASVDREGTLYKVRLGRFASEGEAQTLRERALRAGYLGAFRTRAGP